MPDTKDFAMQDIAKRAGVCKATVSRAFNTPDRVSEKTLNKVMKVVDELGYTPNRLAAGLRQGRSRNIAIMLPDITNPYFPPLVRSIEKIAQARGYSVILNDTQDNPALERAFASMLKTRQVDGVITNSQRLPFDIDIMDPLDKELPPIVNTSEFCAFDGVTKVGVDNVAIGRDATRHLLDLGHTRIAAIMGTPEILSCKQREQGFREELSKSNISLDDRLLYSGDYSSQSGVDGVRKLMQLKDRPTAIFCFGDMVAIGALHELNELGYRVPDDVSVIGVDGIALTQYSHPPLTTIAQPIQEMGQLSITLLLDMIEGNAPKQKLNILPHQLVVRRSTGPAPK
ncbi:LacI family DNA-binding transcriptional regulator [Alteromonas ponticola]|uniref:LacI family transcriptional regulator n=1 Tax=Alteromonas ponticola TaxID=2720613 RepID=A0ABX1R6Q5_9ALTE|nr:LacI family DNA-binding transcriptional regulator [Alteromonas ponticola]NMH61493.1 LacI family transcriptional regulator [Alteromonas ponticola]